MKIWQKINMPKWRVSLKVYSPTGSFTRQCRVKQYFLRPEGDTSSIRDGDDYTFIKQIVLRTDTLRYIEKWKK